MTTPTVKRNTNQSSQTKKTKRTNLLPLGTRRFAAWTVEITLVITSGLVPFALGMYVNDRTQLNRVPLNPVLVLTERAIARPLALPINYGIRYVAWPANFLWTAAILAPITLSLWQLYLLGKTGSTIPKYWFFVRVVNVQGTPAGLTAAIVRESLGRWTIPVLIAYLIWRYSFAFPNLILLVLLTGLTVLGEGMGWPSQKRRRAFHDVLAGTYTVDANIVAKQNQQGDNLSNHEINQSIDQNGSLPNPTRRNPNFTLFVVGVTSMIAVLSTLVGTEIYIQTQEDIRRSAQINSQKFLALIQQLSPNSNASYEDRRNTILAIGSLNDLQSIKFLVDLLIKEANPQNQEIIQQALVHEGLKAIPELKQMNQFLATEIDGGGNSRVRQLRENQLVLNQKTINKILSVYNGKINQVDLSRTQLGEKSAGNNSLFNIVLDNSDLSGVNFKGANLNRASFKGSRFRSPGSDGRWDTYDDVVADLTQAQLKEANFTDANLSRTLMNHSDLSRAVLNRANLSNISLLAANLSSAQLIGADLREGILENASLTGADISDAKLVGADLYAAHLGRASAIGAQLSYANLVKTDWQGADLSESYLDHANLQDANLSATRLTGAVLHSAQLENANLRNADLSRVDLQGANVAGTDFQGAIFFPGKQDPADEFVQTPDTKSQATIVRGVDFSQAKNLDAKQIAFICTQGGIHPHCP